MLYGAHRVLWPRDSSVGLGLRNRTLGRKLFLLLDTHHTSSFCWIPSTTWRHILAPSCEESVSNQTPASRLGWSARHGMASWQENIHVSRNACFAEFGFLKT